MKKLFFSLLVLLAQTAPAAAGEPLRVGVAEADITPPKGFPMAGYYFERLATGTHDPLKAKAMVFLGDGVKAAVVVCDLTGIAVDLTTEVRRRAAARTGIPADHIVLSATHSHTAPDYTKDLYQYLSWRKTETGRKKATYSEKLISGIVDAIAAAHDRARPVLVEAGSARQEVPIAFNRRFVMKDGSVRTWMSLDNPQVVRPAGPIDPEVGLVLIRSADERRPVAVLSNFALHLDTVGGTLWSADYPYYIEQSVRQSLGADVVSVFGTGCCGDINHVDPSRKERNKTDVIGRALGSTVSAAAAKLPAVNRPVLRFRRTVVQAPLQEVSVEQVAKARALLPEAKAGKQVDFLELVTAYKSILVDQLRNPTPAAGRGADFINWGLTHTWAGVGDHLPVEVQTLCLGEDLAVVFLPGEIFVDLGLAIKRASPFRTTLVVELSNCVETVYIPTRAAFAGGSYEVTNSTLKPGSGEMLVEAALTLLREAARENQAAKAR